MGGFGSGRPSGSGRDKVEYSRSIDVNRLHHHGCLSAGWMGCWQWTQDDEKVASINLRAEHDRLHLSYRARIAGGEGETIEEPVRVRISSVPAWSMAATVGGASSSCTARGAISCADTATASHMPVRARARGTARCVAPTRSSNAWAVIPAWLRHFRQSPRVCGDGLMTACAGKPSTPRYAPRKPSK